MSSLTLTPPVIKSRSGSDTRQVLQRNVALYPADIERVQEIQAHYGLDSFSKAMRKAIELASNHIEVERRSVA